MRAKRGRSGGGGRGRGRGGRTAAATTGRGRGNLNEYSIPFSLFFAFVFAIHHFRTSMTINFDIVPTKLDDPRASEREREREREREKERPNSVSVAFHRWDDPNGVDIRSIIIYLNWFVAHGLHSKGNFNLQNFPLVPIIFKKNHDMNTVDVLFSVSTLKKLKHWRLFKNDRFQPMINFMISSLRNQLERELASAPVSFRMEIHDKIHENENEIQNRHSRLLQSLNDGTEIPILLDLSDANFCSKNFTPIIEQSLIHTYNINDGIENNSNMDGSSVHASSARTLPIFSLANRVNCNFTFSLPNYLTLQHAKRNSSEWDAYFTQASSFYPFRNKTNAAVWRGAPTGVAKYENQPFEKKFDRRWLVEYAKSSTDIDAEITDKNSRMPFEDFQKYKAIIDIDGNGWSGRYQRLLCMNSVVVKLESEAVEYNCNTLIPWVHYVPANPNTLEENVKFVLDEKNEELVVNIISNANRWCRDHLKLENLANDLVDILTSYVDELDKSVHDFAWGQIWNKELKNSSVWEKLDFQTPWWL